MKGISDTLKLGKFDPISKFLKTNYTIHIYMYIFIALEKLSCQLRYHHMYSQIKGTLFSSVFQVITLS